MRKLHSITVGIYFWQNFPEHQDQKSSHYHFQQKSEGSVDSFKNGIPDGTEQQYNSDIDGIVGDKNRGQQLFGLCQQLHDQFASGRIALLHFVDIGL